MYVEVGAPIADLVTLQEAKSHLRIVDTISTEVEPEDPEDEPTEVEPEDPEDEPTVVTSHPDDTYIASLIATAVEWGEAFQNRSWITRTITVYLDEWPDVLFYLPMPPIRSITSVSYYAPDNTETTLDPSTYWLAPDGALCLTEGKTWPADALRSTMGVKIVYKAGYGDTASAVPKRCKQAVLLMVGHWYENRENVIVDATANQIPDAAEMLLYQERRVPI